MKEYGFDKNDDFIRVAQKCPTLGGTDFESVPKSTPVNNGGIQMFKDYQIAILDWLLKKEQPIILKIHTQ